MHVQALAEVIASLHKHSVLFRTSCHDLPDVLQFNESNVACKLMSAWCCESCLWRSRVA
jgi:hypothetical protein